MGRHCQVAGDTVVLLVYLPWYLMPDAPQPKLGA